VCLFFTETGNDHHATTTWNNTERYQLSGLFGAKFVSLCRATTFSITFVGFHAVLDEAIKMV